MNENTALVVGILGLFAILFGSIVGTEAHRRIVYERVAVACLEAGKTATDCVVLARR